MGDVQYRHEYKHYLNYADYYVLRHRLAAVLEHDIHADENGEYKIRSLYFDNFRDKALREKLDGVNEREKYRIRCYNSTFSPILLERKSKLGGLGNKQSTVLNVEQTKAIIAGNIDWMTRSKDALLIELYSRMKSELLRPMTIVDYTREPFIFPAGNVRITLDRDIRTGLKCTDFFRTDLPTIPAGDSTVLLEVKYDDFIPGVIVDLLQLGNRRASAFSKYAACRMYE